MKALVVYESMYGNTHVVADCIADGMRSAADVTVVPIQDATKEAVEQADLVVVGGPTHVHGMSSARTRAAAVDATHKPGSTLTLDDSATGLGIREWLEQLADGRGRSAAAFDTRIDAPAVFTGRASRSISKALSHHGFDVIADSRSFLVDRDNHLLDAARDEAREWGRLLVSPLVDDPTR
jgi:Flavodoxin